MERFLLKIIKSTPANTLAWGYDVDWVNFYQFRKRKGTQKSGIQ